MSYLDERRKHIENGRPSPPKKKYKIPQKSEKRLAKEAKEKKERGDDDTDLQKWFKSRIKHMRGVCTETRLPTEIHIYHEAIKCVCHILPQQSCKSVQLHPCNWIELDKDFHKKFDAMPWEEKEKLKCWPIIQERLIMLYPDLDPSEHRHLPESVRKYIDDNYPFSK